MVNSSLPPKPMHLAGRARKRKSSRHHPVTHTGSPHRPSYPRRLSPLLPLPPRKRLLKLNLYHHALWHPFHPLDHLFQTSWSQEHHWAPVELPSNSSFNGWVVSGKLYSLLVIFQYLICMVSNKSRRVHHAGWTHLWQRPDRPEWIDGRWYQRWYGKRFGWCSYVFRKWGGWGWCATVCSPFHVYWQVLR